MLKEFARICLSTLREADLIGRIGGEEFAVIWPETGGASVIDAAERLRAAVESARVPLARGLPVQFTVSIGVATLDKTDVNLDMFLHRADLALYEAKRSGRNRICAS